KGERNIPAGPFGIDIRAGPDRSIAARLAIPGATGVGVVISDRGMAICEGQRTSRPSGGADVRDIKGKKAVTMRVSEQVRLGRESVGHAIGDGGSVEVEGERATHIAGVVDLGIHQVCHPEAVGVYLVEIELGTAAGITGDPGRAG